MHYNLSQLSVCVPFKELCLINLVMVIESFSSKIYLAYEKESSHRYRWGVF
jgi:hypothetical protein